jgi:septum formation protein
LKSAVRKIYLASKNPRRRELLRQIGVEFELLLLRENTSPWPEVSEFLQKGETPEGYVNRVSREKIEYAWQVMVWRKLPVRPVLVADTKVALDGQLLGKPADMTEAKQMLQSLSGRTHQVLSSVAVRYHDETWQTTQRSEVTFATLSDDVIQNYCALQEPYDKSGGYAIHGPASSFILNIAGSYSGIMGLPLHDASQLLQKAGVQIL